MAKKTLIVDDLTGETGAKTRFFRFDGTDYEIDLTDASFAELRVALKPYLRAARQVGGVVVPTTRRVRAGDSEPRRGKSDAAVIRAWARAAGVPVADRGRVHPDVRKAWQAAGSPGKTEAPGS